MTKDELERIKALKRAWEEGTLRATLLRAPERKAQFATTSGIPLWLPVRHLALCQGCAVAHGRKDVNHATTEAVKGGG